MKISKVQTKVRNNMMWLVILALLILFGALVPNFLTWRNLTNICTQSAYLVIASIGAGLVIISGGIDFSVGQCISVVAVCMARFLQWDGLPLPAAVFLGLLVGVLLGCINGTLTSVLEIHPMVATIGTMTTFRGISYLISGSRTIHNLPRSYMAIGQGKLGAVPYAILILVVIALAAHLMLEFTCFGKFLYAAGGNAEAARLAGINPKRMRWTVYVIAGILYAVAAILLTSRGGTGSSSVGSGVEFDAIMACVLGSVSFRGGRGRVPGIIAGCLVLGILSNGMQLLGMVVYVRYVVTGMLMVLTVTYEAWPERRNRKKITSDMTLS